MTKPNSTNRALGHVLAALPGTRNEIQDKSGVSQAAISRWIIYLRSTNEAHVGGWRASISNKGLPQPVFHAGRGLDVECDLRVIPPNEEARRRRGVELRTARLITKRKQRRSAKFPPRCVLTAALYGPA
jgi:hypothetical protein